MIYVICYLLVIVWGFVIGSFLNVCIYRMPKGESVVNPPSHCTQCGKRLKAVDLIPVFSYIFLGGKCRHCKTKISPRYALIELLTAVIFVILYLKYDFTLEFAASAFLMSILIPVFFIDLKHRIIPDELVIAGLIGGALLFISNFIQPVSFYGDRNWWTPLVGMISGSGFLFAIAIIGLIIYKTDDAMGMGDVKIFAPIGLILGWKLAFVALFLSVTLAGLLGVVLMVLKIAGRKTTIPLGPFIVIAVFITLLWGFNIIEFIWPSFTVA